MTVKVWPSKFRVLLDGTECEPLETHELHAETTVGAWLRAEVKGFRPMESPPISVHVNDQFVAPDEWDLARIGDGDTVDIFPEPKAEGVVAFLVNYGAYILAGISLVYSLLMPRPSAPKNQGQVQGRELEEATAKGNQVRLNSVIREVSGRRKIYPDYLLPPHRFFQNQREQIVRMLLCIGKGEFQISPADVLIGDTPLNALGDDATYTIYAPGQSMAGDPCAEWWHSATEVGPTSTGSAGIRLTTADTVSPVATATTFIFAGDTVTIPSGAGIFPTDWAAGMIVRIEAERPLTVTDGGGSNRDIIEGDLSDLAPYVGMEVEIVGDNAGVYRVETFTAGSPDQMTLSFLDGSPVADLTTGTVSMGIGARGLQWRLASVSPTAIEVERLIAGVVDTNWPGFVNMTSTEANIFMDQSDLEGDWAGPFACCPDGEKTSRLEVDFMFPAGLVGIDKKGRPYNVSVTVEIQYRDMAVGGAWTSHQWTYANSTLDQLGFTQTITLPYAMRAEVRARRIGAESTSTQIQDGVQWYGLRARLPIKTQYDGVTAMTVEINGGNRIALQSEQQISVIATRKLPVLSDDGWTAPQATRDIAPFVAYVAKSIGYTDDDIDLAELRRLHSIWSARGDTFDHSVESPTTAKAAINTALRAGFAEFTVDRGRIRPVRDEPRTVFEQMYTPQNMVEPLTRQFTAPSLDDHDGVDVEYVNGTSWAVETVQCRLPGDIGRKVEKITLEGVTDRTRAWRIGMRQRRASKYRRTQYRFVTELDALNSRYLSYCALADDVPGYAQSAILEAYVGGIIVSSEPLDWSAGGPHVIAIRRRDGTLSGPYPATRIDDYRVSIPGLDFTPDTSWAVEPPHILFGPLNRWSYPVLIASISPGGSDRVTVEAVNYDARIYADDDAFPPS